MSAKDETADHDTGETGTEHIGPTSPAESDGKPGTCPSGQHRVDGECTAYAHLRIEIDTFNSEPNDVWGRDDYHYAVGWYLEPSDDELPSDDSIVLVDGPCVVRRGGGWERQLPTHKGVCRDVGKISFESSLGTVVFEPCRANANPVYGPIERERLFAENDSVKISTAGGEFLDATTVEITPLEAPIVSAGPLVPGQPWPITWTPGAGDYAIVEFEIPLVDAFSLFTCRVPDTGSFTVSERVTNEYLSDAKDTMPEIKYPLRVAHGSVIHHHDDAYGILDVELRRTQVVGVSMVVDGDRSP